MTMFRAPPRHGQSRLRGFILAYLMFALALAAISAMGVAQIRSRNVQAEAVAANVGRTLDAITAIRGQMQYCATAYPSGASVQVDGGPTDTVTTEYPVLPGSAPGTLRTGDGLASDMQCPGRPEGLRSLWTGSDGVFFPPEIPGLGPWSYKVSASGSPLRVTRITISLTNTDGEPGRSMLRRVQLRAAGVVELTDGGDTLTVVLLDTAQR
jgi:hypothetical protein